MRKRITIVSILLALMLLSSCAKTEELLNDIAPKEDDAIPGRMVAAIDIEAFPKDPDLSRSYSDLDTVSSVLRELRDLDTSEVPKNEPKKKDSRKYITITVSYANDTQESYCLLEKQYLQDRDGSWCIVDKDKAIDFTQFIKDTPSN